jgi:hypothetical protein
MCFSSGYPVLLVLGSTVSTGVFHLYGLAYAPSGSIQWLGGGMGARQFDWEDKTSTHKVNAEPSSTVI